MSCFSRQIEYILFHAGNWVEPWAAGAAWPTGILNKAGKPVLCHEPPMLPINNCPVCPNGAVECVAVMVRFKWSGKWGGQTVGLSGTFNDWDVVRALVDGTILPPPPERLGHRLLPMPPYVHGAKTL